MKADLYDSSLARAVATSTPRTWTVLRRPRAPALKRTSPARTPSLAASRRASSAFAFPSRAGARRRTRTQPSATPVISLREAPGVAQTASVTPSSAAASGDSPLELVFVHSRVHIGEQVVVAHHEPSRSRLAGIAGDGREPRRLVLLRRGRPGSCRFLAGPPSR